MKTQTHPFYEYYPVHPYISPERNLSDWEENPENYPYAKVEKKQMTPLEEGILSGDVIMLWRVSLNTLTNQSIFPQYFEYKYGIYAPKSLENLQSLGYALMLSATNSLPHLSIPRLKKILLTKGLSQVGKKEALLSRIKENFPEETLAPLFSLRAYQITPKGEKLLEKHQNIIENHGPKM